MQTLRQNSAPASVPGGSRDVVVCNLVVKLGFTGLCVFCVAPDPVSHRLLYWQ